MKEINPQRVFVQYRDNMKPHEPIHGRKYTITHSDQSAELFVFVAQQYARDQFNDIRDEVRISWEQDESGFYFMGFVLLDGEGISGTTTIRNSIFLNEMPIALQALRQADRFLFDNEPSLDSTPIYIQFISYDPSYHKTYDFGVIGDYIHE